MAKPMVKLFSNLENEFESLQKSLTEIDSSIRKVTGKDPSRLFEVNSKPVRNRLRSINTESQRKFIPLKRKLTEAEDEDHANKRSLQSQIVSTSWETKQRNQVLEEQKNDKKSLSRNKRMFGLILGTLEKFKTEESQRKDSKREEIEKKLDKADEQERAALKKERNELFQQRRDKRIQLKCLEQKLQRVEVHKEWEKSKQFIGNFIETRTKPSIFYLPVKHNSETQKRLQETKDKYRIIFAEKRAKMQKDLNDIEEHFKKDYSFEPEEGNDENKVEEEKGDDSNKPEAIDRKHDEPSDENNENSETTDGRIVDANKTEEKQAKRESLNDSEIKETSSNDLNGKENGQLKDEEMETDKDFEPIYD